LKIRDAAAALADGVADVDLLDPFAESGREVL
jgi:hypothetical protein